MTREALREAIREAVRESLREDTEEEEEEEEEEDLVANGDFSTSSTDGWVGARDNETFSVVDGALRVESVTNDAFGVAYEVTGLTVGANYLCTFTGDEGTVSPVYTRVDDVPSLVRAHSTLSEGQASIPFEAWAETLYIGAVAVGGSPGGGDFFTIDNVSVVPV